MVKKLILHKDGLPTSTCRMSLPSKGGSGSSERGYQLFRETLFVFSNQIIIKISSYKTMNDQNKKSWFSRHIILTGILGFILFVAIIGTLAELTGDSEEANISQAPQSQSEYISKVLNLNSCELDSANVDYWQDKEVNFWKDKEKSAVSFKLPACDNLEVEVIEHDEDNKQFKVKYNEQEGWISEMQLIK